ncbi:hypothetical protein CEQ90_07920 [Lewinellaceae bacterium SD302]|nr:hypothetical protein CEQ90_07920 [Lewinellaceae bacterium SD302]
MYHANTIYHVYNQSINRELLFKSDSDYLFFEKKIKKHLLPVCDVLCYCLMPTHFHLQLVPKLEGLNFKQSNKQQELHAAFRIMLSSYTRIINDRRDRRGSIFRAKTKYKPAYSDFIPESWELDEDEPFTRYIPYIKICFDYIHDNPQEAGLVDDALKWNYSSLADYEGYRDSGICNYKLAEKLIGIKRKIL